MSSDYHGGIAGEIADRGRDEQACEKDGEITDTYGGEHYWHCDQPGTITVDGELLCDDHAGELGYGPKQEEYGFDPHDDLNPTPAFFAGSQDTEKTDG